MSRSEMSFAGPTFRLPSGPSTPPAIDTSGGSSAAKAPLPDAWMSEDATFPQGQHATTPDENSWTGCRYHKAHPSHVAPMKSKRYFSDSSTKNLVLEGLISTLEELEICYDEIIGLTFIIDMTVKLYADQQEPCWHRSVKMDHNRTMEQAHAKRLCRWYDAFQDAHNSLTAWLVAAEQLRLVWDEIIIGVPYEPQNEMPYRKAAQGRAQSQQFTLTCSLHGTVLAFAVFHQAWEFTRHMYA